MIEPTCSSPGFAWLANVFMVDWWGWHPKIEMKAVWVQSEKSYLRIKGAWLPLATDLFLVWLFHALIASLERLSWVD